MILVVSSVRGAAEDEGSRTIEGSRQERARIAPRAAVLERRGEAEVEKG